MTENAQGLIDVGRLILRFAKVNRVTRHEDGVRRESDTDHTTMMAVSAPALAERLYPELDRGLIAQFAIVHDLVEAYAMDTDSFGITEEKKQEKDAREYEAFLRIEREFKDIFPWIPEMIQKYDALDTKEARFVKTVDKLLTKVTHTLNGGAYFKSRELSEAEMIRDYGAMVEKARTTYGKEFPELIALMEELINEARKATYEV
jgi:5'-deoxynucleotidase YfbR-like HD superfamily hydrolase